MEQKQILNLGLEEITQFPVEMKNDGRFITSDFGILYKMDERLKNIVMQQAAFPNRLIEGRIILLYEGSIALSANLQKYQIAAPGIIIVSPGCIAQIKEMSDDTQIRMLVFKNEFISNQKQEITVQKYLNGRLNVVLPISQEELACIDSFFSTIWSVLQTCGFEREVMQLQLQSLLHLLSLLLKKYDIEEEKNKTRQEQIFNKFISLVNQHVKEKRNVTYYADKLCLTSRYLNSIVKQVSNRTVMEWINESIILEAKVMLRYSDKLIYQIADDLNFPNVSFFCKFFKRETGMTPLAYQKSR